MQAWNGIFFRLCAFDFGRLLRVDNCTVAREWFDYVRILLATSSLEVINDEADLLVDDDLVNIKIMEEWGFSLGEDACLFEDASICDESEKAEVHVVFVVNNDVENMVNEMTEEWMEEDKFREQEFNLQDNNEDGAFRSKNMSEDLHLVNHHVSTSKVASSCSSVDKGPISQIDPTRCNDYLGCGTCVGGKTDENHLGDTSISPTVNLTTIGDQSNGVATCTRNVVKRTLSKSTDSCPLGRTRSVMSRLLSLE